MEVELTNLYLYKMFLYNFCEDPLIRLGCNIPFYLPLTWGENVDQAALLSPKENNLPQITFSPIVLFLRLPFLFICPKCDEEFWNHEASLCLYPV